MQLFRDLFLALEYGCLENELLDFLLDHHELGREYTFLQSVKISKNIIC